MRVIGAVSGDGALIVREQEWPVRYEISVIGDANQRQASGTLHGDLQALDTAMRAGSAKLRLSDGAEVEVVGTELAASATPALSVHVNGRLPGY